MRVESEDLGGTALSRAVRAGRIPPDWMPRAPASTAEWRAAARTVAAEFAGGAWLDALHDAIRPSGAAAGRLTDVARSGGIVVTTGQQPGLFGGPLLTLVKAMSALALADRLQHHTGIRAAPVFWAATDDADFDEADVVSVVAPASTTIEASADGVLRLRSGARPAAGTPMARAPLGELGPALRVLRESCGSVVDSGPLEDVLRAYASGSTVGDAFVELLRRVLEPRGIAVLDASHPGVREAGGSLMGRALERADRIAAAVHSRVLQIRGEGFEPQVEEVGALSLVFAHEQGIKRRLTIGEAKEASRTVPRDALSPTVLLRPVLERAILPAVAYVAGPGELAYFAQIAPVARLLDVAPPVAVPRWSTTIYEPRVEKILKRLGVDAHEIQAPEKVATRLARSRTPAAMTAAAQGLRDSVDAGLRALREADATGLIPAGVLDGLRASLLAQLDRGDRRIAASVKRRDAALLRDIRVAHASLYPGGVRQERALGWVPFLVRGGPALLDQMLLAAAARADRLICAPAELVEVADPRSAARSSEPPESVAVE